MVLHSLKSGRAAGRQTQ